MGLFDAFRMLSRSTNTPVESVPVSAEVRATEDTDTPLPRHDRGVGAPVAPFTAISLSAVYRAVSLRASAARQIGIEVFRSGEVITSPAFIRQPDITQSFASFIERTVTDLDMHGNAYWLVTRNEAGAVINVKVLNPQFVSVAIDEIQDPIGYFWYGKEYAPGEIIHLRRLRVSWSPYGLGPVQSASMELRGALDMQRYAANWVSSGDMPSGVLKTDQIVTDEDAADIKKRWKERDDHDIAVLGQGVTYDPIYLRPSDLQFLENQKFTTTQVARLFGVPATLMLADSDGNSMTYENATTDWLAFVRWGLMDVLNEIEDAFTQLLPRGQSARFRIEDVLRADTNTRYQAHQYALGGQSAMNAWMTPNEVRAIEGRTPIKGGDSLNDPRMAAILAAQAAPTPDPTDQKGAA